MTSALEMRCRILPKISTNKKKQKRKHFCKGVICRFSIKKKPSQKELYHKFALFSSPHLMSPPPQHTVHLSE